MQLVYSYAVWPKEKPIGNGFLGLREYRILRACKKIAKNWKSTHPTFPKLEKSFFMGKEQFGTKTIYPSKYKKVAHTL